MQIRTNRDGSKTQVVRQYGCNTSSNADPSQNVTFQKDSYVYINGDKIPVDGAAGDDNNISSSDVAARDGAAAAGAGLLQIASTLPRCSTTSSSSAAGNALTVTAAATAVSSNTLPSSSSSASYRGHIVRLNSIEPNTVMFSTKDYPILNDVSVTEIIDELQKQFEEKLCDLQGVRLVANNVYICLSKKESVTHLTTYGFYVRGMHVKVADITNDSVVICLTGVPHYITDATITMLVSTFGIAIGEVERRFYKGVDTGERFVRLKPRPHTQVPDFVTVGGCKILIRVLSQEEVCQPFTLQSASSLTEPTSTSTTSALYTSNSNNGSKTRVKPGHCNGSLTSPTSSLHQITGTTSTTAAAAAAATTSSSALDFLVSTSSCSTTTTSLLSSRPRTEMISTGVTGLLSSPLIPISTSPSGETSQASPKIAKSLRSRLSGVITMKSSPPSGGSQNGEDEKDLAKTAAAGNSYVPGEPLDIPTLSPPPYKAPSSSSASSTAGGGGSNFLASFGRNKDHHHHSETTNGDNKSSSSILASSLRKYKAASKTTTGSGGSLGTSSLAGKSTEAVYNNNNNNNHESGKGRGGGGGSSAAVAFEADNNMKSSKRAGMTSRTVNGILRKGSGPGDDIVEEKQQQQQQQQ